MAATARLVTIGYEGRDLDEVVGCLVAERVRHLVDVRLNAVSRRPGLSKTRLAMGVSAAGISYVHHRELGNPQDNRVALRSGSPAARDRFTQLLTSDTAHSALHHIVQLLQDQTVALLCVERDHERCHRTLVAAAVGTEAPGTKVVHL